MKKLTVCICLAFSFIFLASTLVVDPSPLKSTTANAQSAPIDLSGRGQKASEQFDLEQGLSVFTMNHTGGSNFAVKLLDSSGKMVDLLANDIGNFTGEKAVGVTTPGKYLLDISADGPWTIKVEQPRPESAPSVPKEFTGKGQQVSEPFSTGKGLATIEMTHNGSSNFAVRLLDKSGNMVELLANEIGAFTGSKATSVETGIYVLDISADGDWTVKVAGQPVSAEDLSKAKDAKPAEGCFIATAAYGDSNAPDIRVLRRFRDNVLLTNSVGQDFVETYYDYGPAAANFIADRPVARVIVREVFIRPLVNILE